MTKIISSSKTFHIQLETLYDIEKQLEDVLPKLIAAASNTKLKEGFASHLEETKNHSKRLEQIFYMFNTTPERHVSEGIHGIITEILEVVDTEAPSPLKDAMLAGAARTAEHFEMSAYMTAIEESKTVQNDEVTNLLSQSLAEEEAEEARLAAALKSNLELEEDLEQEEEND